MADLFIYQFSKGEGGEYLSIETERLSDQELADITRPGYDLDQIIECDVLSGDGDMLPTNRSLEHKF